MRRWRLLFTTVATVMIAILSHWHVDTYHLAITGLAGGFLMMVYIVIHVRSAQNPENDDDEPSFVRQAIVPAVPLTLLLVAVMAGAIIVANLTDLDRLFLDSDRAAFEADVEQYKDVNAWSKIEEIAKERLKMPVSKTWQKELEQLVYRAIIAQADALPDGEAKEAKYGEAAKWALDHAIDSEEAAAKQQLAHPTPTPTKTPTQSPTSTATPTITPTPTPAPAILPEGSTAKVVRQESVPGGTVIYLKILDAQGLFIPGLVVKDFVVLVDGQQTSVRVTDLELSPVPKSVVVAIDGSGSMSANDAIGKAREGAVAFLGSLSLGDEVIVLLFQGNTISKVTDWTSDLEEAKRAVAQIKAEGNTPLYDAIFMGARELAGRGNSRKVMVVLSDGADTSSLVGIGQILGQLPVVSPELYVIGLQTEDNDFETLQQIADSVGGTLQRPKSAEEIVTAFRQVGEEIGRQYALTIDIPGLLDGEHQIEIRIGSGQTMYTIVMATVR